MADPAPAPRPAPGPRAGAALHALVHHSAVRYLAVGGVAFVIDLGVLTVCYDGIGMPLWVATGTGFWASFFFNFFVQRRFSFGGTGAGVATSFWRYGALLAVNTVVTMAVVEAFERGGPGFTVGKVVVTVAQTIWNYFAYRHWVFVARPDLEPDPAPERLADH